jgi:lipopolysaccharide export system protein LptA
MTRGFASKQRTGAARSQRLLALLGAPLSDGMENSRPRIVLRLAGIFATMIAAAVFAASPATAEDTARKTNDVLSSVAGVAQNLELADVPSPIDITADRLEFLYGQGVLRYEGNVTVEHAGARIRARTLEVSFEPEGKRSLKKITAKGGVEVTRGDESARGELAEYDPAAATIVLSQNARLGSGPNSIAGEKVVVYLNEKRAVVQGGAAPPPAANTAGGPSAPAAAPAAAPGGRVKAVFMPDALDKKGSQKK